LESKFIAATGCVAAALAFGVTACGSSSSSSGGGGGGGGGKSAAKTVTVYSSLPLQGASRAQAADLVNGEKLALEQAGGKAGNIKVKYVSLDDSTAQAGAWTAEAASSNARKAASDKSTAIYIGEFNSGASAITIPILNEAGIAQLSPANTAVGLTSDKPGHSPGEPQKYYPTGKRNYARIVPIDTIQGAADVKLMKQLGCTKVAMVNDKEVYGQGIAGNIKIANQAGGGLQIVMDQGIDPKAPNYRSLAQKAKSAGADCFFFAGITGNNAVQATKDFAAALGSSAKLFGPDGICESGYIDPKKGGIPVSLDSRFHCTAPTLAPDQYPASAKAFYTAFKQKYGESQPDPYAIYGYEAMNLALDAIKRSKTGEKADIVKALFATKDRQSALGTYSIDRNGDTTLTEMALDGVRNGELKFIKVIHGAAL
jgi:branched-chain amino acid transport system substrate-binding protein